MRPGNFGLYQNCSLPIGEKPDIFDDSSLEFLHSDRFILSINIKIESIRNRNPPRNRPQPWFSILDAPLPPDVQHSNDLINNDGQSSSSQMAKSPFASVRIPDEGSIDAESIKTHFFNRDKVYVDFVTDETMWQYSNVWNPLKMSKLHERRTFLLSSKETVQDLYEKVEYIPIRLNEHRDLGSKRNGRGNELSIVAMLDKELRRIRNWKMS